MGLFSWITQDTGKSIPADGSNRETFRVHMHDNKNNIWSETNYEGYGKFGGKDYYVLVAEMNGHTEADGDLRDIGINLAFSDEPCLHPNLTETPRWNWIDEEPEGCEFQGWFYGNDEDDEDEEW